MRVAAGLGIETTCVTTVETETNLLGIHRQAADSQPRDSDLTGMSRETVNLEDAVLREIPTHVMVGPEAETLPKTSLEESSANLNVSRSELEVLRGCLADLEALCGKCGDCQCSTLAKLTLLKSGLAALERCQLVGT